MGTLNYSTEELTEQLLQPGNYPGRVMNVRHNPDGKYGAEHPNGVNHFYWTLRLEENDDVPEAEGKTLSAFGIAHPDLNATPAAKLNMRFLRGLGLTVETFDVGEVNASTPSVTVTVGLGTDRYDEPENTAAAIVLREE